MSLFDTSTLGMIMTGCFGMPSGSAANAIPGNTTPGAQGGTGPAPAPAPQVPAVPQAPNPMGTIPRPPAQNPGAAPIAQPAQPSLGQFTNANQVLNQIASGGITAGASNRAHPTVDNLLQNLFGATIPQKPPQAADPRLGQMDQSIARPDTNTPDQNWDED